MTYVQLRRPSDNDGGHSAMGNSRIKALLIEDNPDDARLLLRRLGRATERRFEVKLAKSLAEALDHIAQDEPDIILSDLGLPDSHGLDTVTKILCVAPHIPLVVLSGFDDEATAIRAVKCGAQDYLVKGKLEGSQIERSIFYAIERRRLQTELEQNAREMSRVQTNLLKVLEKNVDAIIVVSQRRQVIFTNPACERLFGYREKELRKRTFDLPLSKGMTQEVTIPQPGGDVAIAEMNVVDIEWEGRPAYLVSLHDITQRKKAEEALRLSEDKFAKAFRHSPDGFVISSLDEGTIIEANDTFLRLTGYRHEEIIGRKSSELGLWVNPQERAEIVRVLKDWGSVHQRECFFRMKSGEIRLWLFSAEIISIEGKPFILSVTTDITERKKIEEELRFSDTALKSIHEGIFATDNSFRITRWNRICEELFGIKAADAIGKLVGDVIAMVEDYPGQNAERISRLLTQGYNREEQVYRTPRGYIWVDVHAQAIEENGKRYGWVTLVSDITEQKKAREALKQSEEKYRQLISTSFDGIIATDAQMRVLIWNRGAERIFGYTEGEMLGRSIMKIVPEEARERMKARYALFEKSPAGKDLNGIFEVTGIRKDGSAVPLEISVSVREAAGSVIITIITRDITERKEAEEKLRQIEKMKAEFLANVSHELRTPLQSISGFTKLLLDGQVPDPATQQEFLQIIDQETAHLGNLINSLLDLSRLESGRFTINKRLLAVGEVITGAIRSFHSLARDKDITLHEDIPEDLPEMEVDDERLRQVIMNLVSNAIKYSNSGGSVTVRVRRQGKDLLVQVSDRGIGIPPQAMEHLFERFYRAENNQSRGGTGLGLYITKQIIDAHGGHIWVESKLNEGSTFSFTLPISGEGGGHGKEDPHH